MVHSGAMKPLLAFGLWRWIEDNRAAFEPPVGNKVIWEDSQFTAMVIRGPNARRDFHVDPSDEIFYMLEGDMDLEYLEDGQRRHRTIHEGEMFLVPALTPHSPHRPAETWGLVIEIKRMTWWLIHALRPFVPLCRELSEMAYLWREPHRIDGSKLQAAIGDIPHTPLDDAVARALEDLRASA